MPEGTYFVRVVMNGHLIPLYQHLILAYTTIKVSTSTIADSNLFLLILI